jgi:hypothetical protein
VIVTAIIVTGIMQRERVQLALLDVTCTAGGCHPVALAIGGWAMIGLPMLLAWASYRRFGWSRVGTWATVLSLSLMAFGLGSFIVGKGEAAIAADAFVSAHPEVQMFGPGWGSALVALLVAAGVARFTGGDKADAYTTTSGRALNVVGACQVVALFVAIVWAAVA